MAILYTIKNAEQMFGIFNHHTVLTNTIYTVK